MVADYPDFLLDQFVAVRFFNVAPSKMTMVIGRKH